MREQNNDSVQENKAEYNIEFTAGEDNVSITKQLDPSKIKITTMTVVLQNIIERLEYGEINIFTEFQRHSGLWNTSKQSRLIESILLKLPLPAFYFDGANDNKWDVIDGLQRINTIKNFVIDGSLILQNLEFLVNLNGKKYHELPRDLQRRIKGFEITAYIIEAGTPDDFKYNIFNRINTGGLVLEPQEIRHALNRGIPAKFVEELARLECFKIATDYRVSELRMQDRDFVNRFIAFYLLGYINYEPDLDSFMSKGMALIKQLSDDEREILKERFIQAMELAYQIFGNDAFRKRLAVNDRKNSINKALFDCLSICFSSLNNEQKLLLTKKSEEFKKLLMETMHESFFYKALSHGTSHKGSVKIRFEAIITIFKKVIGNDFEVTDPKF